MQKLLKDKFDVRHKDGQVYTLTRNSDGEFSISWHVGSGISKGWFTYTDEGIRQYIKEGTWEYVTKGVEMVNGVDGAGNPLNFTEDMLKPLMRVLTADGMYIVVPNNRQGEGKFGIADMTGWCEFRTPDTADESQYERYHTLEVYEAPAHCSDMLKPERHGSLLWKYVEPVVEKTPEQEAFEKRLAYFQTHLDAVKENLASLEQEYEQLKQQGTK